jgi:Relaxase/Mobilisation nuclease domain
VIPRIQTGTSFKGAGLYYLHDKKREGETERLTTGRVAWTHSLNTLEDDPEAVLAEMRQTAFDQTMLKHLAGKRGDGRPTEQTVMTVALAWSPDQSPDRQAMIDAGTSFLKHMGWEDHQVLFVAHNDTKHPHVHLIINRVHPETGMTMDDAWSKRRSQVWALAYEKEHGRIYCEAREAKYGNGQDIDIGKMNYREWREWKELSKDTAFDPAFRHSVEAGEWGLLKEAQRKERMAYWHETGQMRKELRNELREQVREEFAEEWQDYATLKDQRLEKLQAREKKDRLTIAKLRRSKGSGARPSIGKIKDRQAEDREALREELIEMRADISSRQKERLEELATPALDQLSKERLAHYQDLLARHRADRAELRGDQAQGIRRHDLLPGAAEQSVKSSARSSKAFDRSPSEPQQPRGGKQIERESFTRASDVGSGDATREKPLRRDPSDLIAGAGLAAIGKIAESLESLFDGGPKSENEQEHKMSQGEEKPEHLKPQPPRQNEGEAEAKSKRDLDFYLQQRARARDPDRER